MAENMFFMNSQEKLIKEMTTSLRSLSINPKTAVIINIDVINGFFKQGNLFSPRLTPIIPKIIMVNEYFMSSKKIFFTDVHTEESKEFETYPSHCVSSFEQDIIVELDLFAKDACVIKKNSTNPFMAADYVHWLALNRKEIENYIIVGCCTDICVMQYALTQRAYLNENNLVANVIVIENAVQTFHNHVHDGNMMHTLSIYNMLLNGIKLATI